MEHNCVECEDFKGCEYMPALCTHHGLNYDAELKDRESFINEGYAEMQKLAEKYNYDYKKVFDSKYSDLENKLDAVFSVSLYFYMTYCIAYDESRVDAFYEERITDIPLDVIEFCDRAARWEKVVCIIGE